MRTQDELEKAIFGCLLGTAVGDALGLPFEGLPRTRIARLAPRPLRHSLLFGRGMVSDDTEHACMTAQALIRSAGEPHRFALSLSWRLRWWLLGLPAGIGWATFRAIVRMWIGFSPSSSGVFSAGNGAAMRAPILGIFSAKSPEELRHLVKISTRMTHSDPKAEWASLAVALAAAAMIRRWSTGEFEKELFALLPAGSENFRALMEMARLSAERGESAEEFANDLGLEHGISGYAFHTVPVLLQIWMRHRADFKAAITEAVFLGGDTDTVAAILGGIIGAAGEEAIPDSWADGILEFPRDRRHLHRLAARLAKAAEVCRPQPEVRCAVWAVPVRNLLFFLLLLAQIPRRRFMRS